MTTQSEQDELQAQIVEILDNSDTKDCDFVGGWRFDTELASSKLCSLIHQRELSLLDEVGKRVISNEVHVRHVCPPESCLGYKTRREMRTKQCQTLQAMRKERL